MVSTNNLLKLMKTNRNSGFSSSPKVPENQKSTHENFVSAWFSSSGTQDVSVARRAPSNPFCPVALYPRKPFRESLWGFYASCHQAFVRFAHFWTLSFLSLWKQAFSYRNVNVQPLRGRLDGYKRKKTQRFAVLSCSGTQDWTADLMIMNHAL